MFIVHVQIVYMYTPTLDNLNTEHDRWLCQKVVTATSTYVEEMVCSSVLHASDQFVPCRDTGDSPDLQAAPQ